MKLLAVNRMEFCFPNLKVEANCPGDQLARINIEQGTILEDLLLVKCLHTLLEISPIRVPIVKEGMLFAFRMIGCTYALW